MADHEGAAVLSAAGTPVSAIRLELELGEPAGGGIRGLVGHRQDHPGGAARGPGHGAGPARGCDQAHPPPLRRRPVAARTVIASQPPGPRPPSSPPTTSWPWYAATPPARRWIGSSSTILETWTWTWCWWKAWKGSELPRIEVHRSELGRPLICRGDGPPDPHLLAVASNAPLTVDVPVLDLDDPPAVLAFIRERFDLSRMDRRVNRPDRLEQRPEGCRAKGRNARRRHVPYLTA